MFLATEAPILDFFFHMHLNKKIITIIILELSSYISISRKRLFLYSMQKKLKRLLKIMITGKRVNEVFHITIIF